MLQIKDLTILHKKGRKGIIAGFSSLWGEGDRAVLIGEEGNGKSTLLKLDLRSKNGRGICRI